MSAAEQKASTPSRKKARRASKKKRVAKIRSDREYAKTYFEGRSKRSADKKSTFRKKKSGKKK